MIIMTVMAMPMVTGMGTLMAQAILTHPPASAWRSR